MLILKYHSITLTHKQLVYKNLTHTQHKDVRSLMFSITANSKSATSNHHFLHFQQPKEAEDFLFGKLFHFLKDKSFPFWTTLSTFSRTRAYHI